MPGGSLAALLGRPQACALRGCPTPAPFRVLSATLCSGPAMMRSAAPTHTGVTSPHSRTSDVLRTGAVADNREVTVNFTLFRMFTWQTLFIQMSYRQEQPRERQGSQRPWFLTAPAAATAASGSRYRPPGGSGRDDASSLQSKGIPVGMFSSAIDASLIPS